MSGAQVGGVDRLVSGIRPSGPMHVGQYVGVLRQWLACQDAYDCFFMIANVQALTTRPSHPETIAESVREIALDWLAVGLDPDRACFFVQSRVREFAELTIYLQMLVRTGELRSNPTTREEARALGKGNLHDALNDVDFGFLGYPVAQVADVLLFTTAPPGPGDRLVVPVGEDQLPHVQLARVLAQRFNETHGEVFLLPEAKTARVAMLPGIDGGYKMGKSLRNAIFLKDPEEEFEKKIRTMFTDPLRARPEDPGHPDQCPCYAWLDAFGMDPAQLVRRREDCLAATAECEECKGNLVERIRDLLGPIQERRERYASRPDAVREILAEGSKRARSVARETMARVRDAMKLDEPVTRAS